jgi:hypothetical protein
MLILTKKQYEIEEDIILNDESGNNIYKFRMQLNSDELKQLQKLLIGNETLKKAKQIENYENKNLSDEEIDKVINMAEELNSTAEDLIGKLCFKENKDKFIELGGQAKYEEMIEVISDYLLGFFIQKKTSRVNIINSDLQKIMNK